ncbi:DUF2839 domain-containing protein [Thermosynechococcus sp. JY1334]|uniref:DUF2839 domain-containing protein n=1 Tax=unclassified Thermosynechococcus TaxID=2622553 RepID=UPI0019826AEC|nr:MULTISPECIES: DUF2839 domain-containing protein [unclassified Thermosynechococcus]MDR5638862.1 DUF2839 domain-containing protein [Thermosynechococcus sp. PP42]MDR7897959.1 DUF2839 domain-containing protein [Thermosynechococcus sp. JY1332]MDR7905359.1 DUF2839 domain-containing protein [Thermosynechococcus sp. JY1334]MDR7922718.1 DUF2839 domain-containing protein [Thermosynechococcus sp. HY213]MDR7993183.1 DUF2839 domain-containing protein [Thermosynechococcus sp. TG252]
MGEAKRRKETLGEAYGQQKKGWLQKEQLLLIQKWVTRGTWVGIGLLVVIWLTVRFIGPSLGWWQLTAN